MAVDNVTTSGGVGIDGNKYTTAVNNDKLTNDDFLKLMLTEMQYQDPTKPMDSQQLMDSQLKMSTIETNLEMADSMRALQTSFAQTSLSSATNIMGRTVETGELNAEGSPKSFKINTVELRDGDVYLNAQEIIGIQDTIYNNATKSFMNFDSTGKMYDAGGNETGEYVLLENGRVAVDQSGNLTILDSEGNVVTKPDGEGYDYAGADFVYSNATKTLSYNDITKVY